MSLSQNDLLWGDEFAGGQPESASAQRSDRQAATVYRAAEAQRSQPGAGDRPENRGRDWSGGDRANLERAAGDG